MNPLRAFSRYSASIPSSITKNINRKRFYSESDSPATEIKLIKYINTEHAKGNFRIDHQTRPEDLGKKVVKYVLPKMDKDLASQIPADSLQEIGDKLQEVEAVQMRLGGLHSLKHTKINTRNEKETKQEFIQRIKETCEIINEKFSPIQRVNRITQQVAANLVEIDLMISTSKQLKLELTKLHEKKDAFYNEEKDSEAQIIENNISNIKLNLSKLKNDQNLKINDSIIILNDLCKDLNINIQDVLKNHHDHAQTKEIEDNTPSINKTKTSFNRFYQSFMEEARKKPTPEELAKFIVTKTQDISLNFFIPAAITAVITAIVYFWGKENAEARNKIEEEKKESLKSIDDIKKLIKELRSDARKIESPPKELSKDLNKLIKLEEKEINNWIEGLNKIDTTKINVKNSIDARKRISDLSNLHFEKLLNTYKECKIKVRIYKIREGIFKMSYRLNNIPSTKETKKQHETLINRLNNIDVLNGDKKDSLHMLSEIRNEFYELETNVLKSKEYLTHIRGEKTKKGWL